MCMEVLQGPVELPCSQLVCASCCISSIGVSASEKCPCCYKCDLAEDLLKAPSQIVCDLLAGLTVKCPKCHVSVLALSYLAHLDTGCGAPCDTPSKHSIHEMLHAPVDSPVTSMEAKAAGRVIQRLINRDGSGPVVSANKWKGMCTTNIYD